MTQIVEVALEMEVGRKVQCLTEGARKAQETLDAKSFAGYQGSRDDGSLSGKRTAMTRPCVTVIVAMSRYAILRMKSTSNVSASSTWRGS